MTIILQNILLLIHKEKEKEKENLKRNFYNVDKLSQSLINEHLHTLSTVLKFKNFIEFLLLEFDFNLKIIENWNYFETSSWKTQDNSFFQKMKLGDYWLARTVHCTLYIHNWSDFHAMKNSVKKLKVFCFSQFTIIWPPLDLVHHLFYPFGGLFSLDCLTLQSCEVVVRK